MIKKEENGNKVVMFNSISELVQFNREAERTQFYKNYHMSDEIGCSR